MRSFSSFLKDVTRKPPHMMPFVALAHVLWLLWTIWGLRYISVASIEWVQALWLIGYTVTWIAACDLRKWGALGYMLLTLLNVCLFLLLKNINDRELYMSNLFILDGLFSFFLLFFYKRFR